MAGHKPWSDLKARFTPEQQKEISDQVRALQEEMLLVEIRKLTGMTAGDAGQPNNTGSDVQIEEREGMPVGALRRFVESLGGELEITAHLPHARISIKPLPRCD